MIEGFLHALPLVVAMAGVVIMLIGVARAVVKGVRGVTKR